MHYVNVFKGDVAGRPRGAAARAEMARADVDIVERLEELRQYEATLD